MAGTGFPDWIRPQPFVPVRVRLEPQVSLLLDPYDFVSRSVLENGFWEEHLWRRAESDLPEGGTFVDVGAHIGTRTLRAAKRVGYNGCVLAIELNPKILTQLRDNIRASGAQFVTVAPVACGDAETTLILYEAPA